MISISRRLISLLVAVAGVIAVAAPSVASAQPTTTCTGTPQSPGVLSGNYSGDVRVVGACAANHGPAVINGNLTITHGSAVVAAFGRENSSLTVKGNVIVQDFAALILGCNPNSSPCFDDNPEHPTLTSNGFVGGNVLAHDALGVIVHSTTIGGRIDQRGGGGGVTCNPVGFFAAIGSPAFTTYEDSTIGRGATIRNVKSCWMGFNRDHVQGSVRFINNQFADPDAIEILDNHIRENLVCEGDSMVWDSFDVSEHLYPRVYRRNHVGGKRVGQCVLESPRDQGGAPGPLPF